MWKPVEGEFSAMKRTKILVACLLFFVSYAAFSTSLQNAPSLKTFSIYVKNETPQSLKLLDHELISGFAIGFPPHEILPPKGGMTYITVLSEKSSKIRLKYGLDDENYVEATAHWSYSEAGRMMRDPTWRDKYKQGTLSANYEVIDGNSVRMTIRLQD